MLPEWLVSLIAGALAFATADVLCDIVIAEDDSDDEDDELVKTVPLSTPCRSGFSAPGYSSLAQETPGDTSGDEEQLPPTPSSKYNKAPQAPAYQGLSGAQDAAISGLVNISAGLFVNAVHWLVRDRNTPSLSSHLKWQPGVDPQFWFALFGGTCAFLHDYWLLRAFEGAPSTVLLPLIQVASVSVLFGSSFVALYRGEQWLTMTHALAYALMFFGGLLPATGGDVSRLLRRSFWGQSYVTLAVLSELAYGLHDLLASACSYDSHGAGGPDWFVWSRVGYIATFVAMYVCVPRLKGEFVAMFDGRISRLIFIVSGASELLALLGYFLMSRALSRFHQPALVHAAEASLSQLLNLLLAFLLLRGCAIGRQSAVTSMRAKLLSFVLVTAGLIACTLDDESHSAGATGVTSAASGALAAAQRNVTSSGGADLAMAAVLAGSNAQFYNKRQSVSQWLALPVKYGGGGYGGGGRQWRGGKRAKRRHRKAEDEYFFNREAHEEGARPARARGPRLD